MSTNDNKTTIVLELTEKEAKGLQNLRVITENHAGGDIALEDALEDTLDIWSALAPLVGFGEA